MIQKTIKKQYFVQTQDRNDTISPNHIMSRTWLETCVIIAVCNTTCANDLVRTTMSDAAVQGYNIVTLLKRLEAATSRLEDLTVFHAEALVKSTQTKPSIEGDDEASVTSLLEGKSEDKATGASNPRGGLPPAIQAFEELLKGSLTQLLALSKSLDPLIEEQVTHLFKAFEAQLRFLEATLQAKKPDVAGQALGELFKPISQHAESIINIRETNRGSPYVNHLATISEGIPALGWVTVNAPLDYITDYKDSAQFYANRILKEYKETDRKHFEWSRMFTKIVTELQEYVKKFHAQGLQWNENGKPLEEVLKETNLAANKARTAAPAPAPGLSTPPPPPPPPPPMPPASVFTAGEETSASGMGAVFQELNKGEGITAGLKKMDKNQKHPRPESESTKKSPAPPPKKKPASLSGPSTKPKKKPARQELVDTKWIIENFENDHEIIIHGEMNQGVFIDRCNNCTIQIKGKLSAVTVNECAKTGILVETLVSGVDIIKSSGFGLQVVGTMPNLTIDQSHDGQVYLSKDSLGVDIYTSQTSGINIEIPKAEEGDYDESPLPEQIVHRFVDNKIVSTVVELQQ
jgi:adenylyl cyclase-associated protein